MCGRSSAITRCRSTGFRYYQKFPQLCKTVSERYKRANHKVFDLKEAERIIKVALKETPVPSFSEAAGRICCKRETLNKKLPKLSAKLHGKYADHLEESRKQNKQKLSEEIIRTIAGLQTQGRQITENSIRKLITKKGNDKNFKQVYREIKNQLNIN